MAKKLPERMAALRTQVTLLAVLFSFLLPGSGQLWQGRIEQGALFMGLWLVLWLIPLAIVFVGSMTPWLLVCGGLGHVAAAVDAARFPKKKHRYRRLGRNGSNRLSNP